MTRSASPVGSGTDPRLTDAVLHATGRSAVRVQPLGGGCVSAVRRIHLDDGSSVVAKIGGVGQPDLRTESIMLASLYEHDVPVPEVLFADTDMLILSWIENDGALTRSVETDAARVLAALHGVTASSFGFTSDTLIGPLPQANPWTPSWRDFFRDQRLLLMARLAGENGGLPARVRTRIEALAGRLDRWIDDDAPPSLIHGDLWTGNVLCRDGRLAGVIDPAVYFADAEIELAFTTLFGTFGDAFFASYAELRPLRPGFFEIRKDLYNLFPLLVHVRLFGGSYVPPIVRTLDRLGV